MNNLKTMHILGWMFFCMFMPFILVAGTFGFAEYSHKSEDYIVLILFLISYAGLLAIPLSLLNIFLFKRNLSANVAKRIATIPLGFGIACSGILFLLSFLCFLGGRFEAIFILVTTALHFFIAINAIYWFRDKIEQSTSNNL
ncbi:hypothetical protein [Fibrobacter succinogenes]|uniref:hypothetical protein n=1 Tax=Fibrobacter succinogenes TaxID=833 RepID=UPI001569748A|nr:hypothetical protein [Fibrobacter succinogenes]